MAEIPKTPTTNEIPDEFVQSEITRSTAPLDEAIANGVSIAPEANARGKALLGERVLKITNLIEQSPDRLAVDVQKAPHNRTEYDKERAHLMALTIDGNMTRLAAYDRKREAGKKLLPWQESKAQKHLLGAKMGGRLAAEVYNDDPAQAGPNAVELRKLRSVNAGYKSYNNIKGAKPPRR